jgi:hypothetical protein
MFLGVHPDYRNNLDIANAVATFGQYHTWNSNDPVKDRVLVYASFPSPQLVPRDVVFGKFASIGGVKESWTAPVYILTADFAEVLPADEDPMPLDGNPHPFPGELMPNQNLFVNPQYPEIGWDAVQDFPDNAAGQDNGNQPVQMDDLQQEEQESMVVNLSDSSGSSVNMLAMEVPQQLQHGNVNVNVQIMHCELSLCFIGPDLPPLMKWNRLKGSLLPVMLSKFIAAPVQGSVFAFIDKSIWGRSKMGMSPSILLHDDEQQKKVADVHSVLTVDVSMTLSTPKKRRNKRSATPVVQLSERRFTRSCLNKEGYRPQPMLTVEPKIKKKSRAKLLLVNTPSEEADDMKDKEEKEGSTEHAEHQIPVTPSHVMQRVGAALGIAPEKLTKEQLEADPKGTKTTDGSNDK